MTKTQGLLAGIGAVAVAAGITIAVRSGAAPPPGYWGSPPIVHPCPSTPPGTVPYMTYVAPGDPRTLYIRYDVGALAVETTAQDGQYGGQGGSAHVFQYYLSAVPDSFLKMLIPLGDGNGNVYPAPWRDVPLPVALNQQLLEKELNGLHALAMPTMEEALISTKLHAASTSTTLCEAYAALGGTHTCPSNVSMLTYSGQIRTTGQWTSSYPVYIPQINSDCAVPVPSKTPTGAVPPSPTAVPVTVIPPTPPTS